MKSDCYKCRWRAGIPGDAHSQCKHPYNVCLLDNAKLQMLAILANVGRVSMPPMADERLKIKANPHGVKSGWFNYPFNFDPIWLENCEGFQEANPNEPRVINKCSKPVFCVDCSDRFKCFTEKGKENSLDN